MFKSISSQKPLSAAPLLFLLFSTLTFADNTSSSVEGQRLDPSGPLFQSIFASDWEHAASNWQPPVKDREAYQTRGSGILRTAQNQLASLFFNAYPSQGTCPKAHDKGLIPLAPTYVRELVGHWRPAQCPTPFSNYSCWDRSDVDYEITENGVLKISVGLVDEVVTAMQGTKISEVAMYRESCVSNAVSLDAEANFQVSCRRAFKHFGGNLFGSTQGDLREGREDMQLSWDALAKKYGPARISRWFLINRYGKEPRRSDLEMRWGVSEGYESDNTLTGCRIIDTHADMMLCFSRAKRIHWLDAGRLQLFFRKH